MGAAVVKDSVVAVGVDMEEVAFLAVEVDQVGAVFRLAAASEVLGPVVDLVEALEADSEEAVAAALAGVDMEEAEALVEELDLVEEAYHSEEALEELGPVVDLAEALEVALVEEVAAAVAKDSAVD